MFFCLLVCYCSYQWFNDVIIQQRKNKILNYITFYTLHFPQSSFSYYLHTFKYYSLIQSLYMYIILYLFLLYISTLWTLHTPRFRHSAFPCFPPNQIIGRKMFCLSVTKKRANISVAFCHKCGFEARILCLTLRKYLEELLLKRFSQSSYPVFAVSSNQGLSTSYLLVRENTLFPNPVNPH